MKILFVNQFFWPDLAATGQFLEDLVRHLGGEGHEITVICSGNRYADAIPAGGMPPARIIRVRGIAFARSLSGRGLSYLSFFAGAFWQVLRAPRHDVIVTMTTPPLLSLLGELLRRFRGTRHFVWEMDLFPDALVSLGAMREGSLPDRTLGLIADYCRKRSEAVIALGSCMQERLLKRGIPAQRIRVAENWADGEAFHPGTKSQNETLHVLYSGNLGLSHDIETVAEAMHMLDGDRRFRFSFAGGGAGRKKLEELCRIKGTGNVAFLPYARRCDVAATLAAADIGLVTLRPECVGTVVPSKVYGLLAAGTPILFIGPRIASASRLIEQHGCGWQVDSGDPDALVHLLGELQQRPNLVRAAGIRARQVLEQHYDRRIGVGRIAGILGIPAIAAARTPDVHQAAHCETGSAVSTVLEA